jgi:arginine utilization protein RocB
MEDVLNFADIKQPLVLLGFAPPYYPAIHSDMIPGHDGSGTKIYNRIAELSMDMFGQRLAPENYAMGISDLSYCAVNKPFDTEAYSDNTPMWGDLYSIDFESIANLNVPSILYGPVYSNVHQWTERVNKKSLFEVVPAVTKRIIEEQWEGGRS